MAAAMRPVLSAEIIAVCPGMVMILTWLGSIFDWVRMRRMMMSCNPPRDEIASTLPFQFRNRRDARSADQVLQRTVDEEHDRAHVDAAEGGGDGGADGGGVLNIAGEQHFDVERGGHDDHLGGKPLLLEEAKFFGDEERHRGDGD